MPSRKQIDEVLQQTFGLPPGSAKLMPTGQPGVPKGKGKQDTHPPAGGGGKGGKKGDPAPPPRRERSVSQRRGGRRQIPYHLRYWSQQQWDDWKAATLI